MIIINVLLRRINFTNFNSNLSILIRLSLKKLKKRVRNLKNCDNNNCYEYSH